MDCFSVFSLKMELRFNQSLTGCVNNYVLKNQNSLIKKLAQLVLKACSLVTPEEFI